VRRANLGWGIEGFHAAGETRIWGKSATGKTGSNPSSLGIHRRRFQGFLRGPHFICATQFRPGRHLGWPTWRPPRSHWASWAVLVALKRHRGPSRPWELALRGAKGRCCTTFKTFVPQGEAAGPNTALVSSDGGFGLATKFGRTKFG